MADEAEGLADQLRRWPTYIAAPSRVSPPLTPLELTLGGVLAARGLLRETAPVARDAQLARRLWSRLEPIHAVTYFFPEARAALSDAGYRGFWMGYFAGRAAPLGPVGPEIVFATFYNFSMAHVSRAIPDAWRFAPPSVALQARLDGAVASLRRAFGDEHADRVESAAVLARAAAESAPMEGRPLFAANRALPWPDDPIAALWQAATLLREHRGDGHVAALTAAGISGRESHVLQAAAGAVPPAVFAEARHFDDTEWHTVSAGLAGRGLLDQDDKLTRDGAALKDDIEARTDHAALRAYDGLSDGQLQRLIERLEALTRAVLRTQDIPKVTPIGPIFEV